MADESTTLDTLSAAPPGSLGWARSLIRDMMGAEPARFTAPGGRNRRSVRVLLDDGRSVIATRCDDPVRAEAEAGLLQFLAAEGAPVPRVLGLRDGLLLQSDAGRNRLSFVMQKADADTQVVLGRAAMAGLQTCRAALARRPDLLGRLPGLGTRPGWAENFVSRPFFLSGDLGIAPPDIDSDMAARALTRLPEAFTRWDARLANAAAQPDGSVVWFDWQLFGRRAGVEDLGWLIADDWWSLDAARSEALLSEIVPFAEDRVLARRVALFVGAARLGKIHARIEAAGWGDADEALRLDLIGAVPEVVLGLSARMAALARDDTLVGGLADWFDAAGAALLSRAE